jgi:hypothetical protein
VAQNVQKNVTSSDCFALASVFAIVLLSARFMADKTFTRGLTRFRKLHRSVAIFLIISLAISKPVSAERPASAAAKLLEWGAEALVGLGVAAAFNQIMNSNKPPQPIFGEKPTDSGERFKLDNNKESDCSDEGFNFETTVVEVVSATGFEKRRWDWRRRP